MVLIAFLLCCAVCIPVSAVSVVNQNYCGFYFDDLNDEAYVSIADDGFTLNAYYYGNGVYVRTYCTTGYINYTKFSASINSAHRCDSEGNFINYYVSNFVTQGNTNTIGTPAISIDSKHGRTYVKE